MQLSGTVGAAHLALGTVQFGLPYGVANSQGQVSIEHAETMLRVARTAGIDTLDTAIAYGEAETMLGRIGVSGFRIISKLPALHDVKGAVEDWVLAQVEASLQRLHVSRLSGLMLHMPDDLLGPHGVGLASGLQRARDSGLVERIGLSVYSPEQLTALVDRLPLEIIQIPFNIFDRRFFETGWLDRLIAGGVEIHARSAFLQGLLLMQPHLIPSKFTPFRQLIDDWHTWVNGEVEVNRLPLKACLAHVLSYPEISRIVVGADSPSQLKEIIASVAVTPHRAPVSLASHNLTLIVPSRWKKT